MIKKKNTIHPYTKETGKVLLSLPPAPPLPALAVVAEGPARPPAVRATVAPAATRTAPSLQIRVLAATAAWAARAPAAVVAAVPAPALTLVMVLQVTAVPPAAPADSEPVVLPTRRAARGALSVSAAAAAAAPRRVCRGRTRPPNRQTLSTDRSRAHRPDPQSRPLGGLTCAPITTSDTDRTAVRIVGFQPCLRNWTLA